MTLAWPPFRLVLANPHFLWMQRWNHRTFAYPHVTSSFFSWGGGGGEGGCCPYVLACTSTLEFPSTSHPPCWARRPVACLFVCTYASIWIHRQGIRSGSWLAISYPYYFARSKHTSIYPFIRPSNDPSIHTTTSASASASPVSSCYSLVAGQTNSAPPLLDGLPG